MGREVRRVPRGWQHPRYADGGRKGQLHPLHDVDFETAAARWKRELIEWEARVHDGQRDHPEVAAGLEYWEWDGGPPDREFHRPRWEETERTCLQVYETVTEGTPVSPIFEDEEQLVAWLVGEGVSEVNARAFSRSKWAPSAVVVNGIVIRSLDSASELEDNPRATTATEDY